MAGGTILERIKDIELEISRTQKNKATTTHLGSLRAKLCKLRRELLEPAPGSGGGSSEGFEVSKTGDARVALIGFPSVGKSTILSEFTTTKSEVASYEFTTLTCIPGVLSHRGCKIQVLDLPGIIEGASQGKGRGRQVIAVAKSADLVLMVLDAASGKSEEQVRSRGRRRAPVRPGRATARRSPRAHARRPLHGSCLPARRARAAPPARARARDLRAAPQQAAAQHHV